MTRPWRDLDKVRSRVDLEEAGNGQRGTAHTDHCPRRNTSLPDIPLQMAQLLLIFFWCIKKCDGKTTNHSTQRCTRLKRLTDSTEFKTASWKLLFHALFRYNLVWSKFFCQLRSPTKISRCDKIKMIRTSQCRIFWRSCICISRTNHFLKILNDCFLCRSFRTYGTTMKQTFVCHKL